MNRLFLSALVVACTLCTAAFAQTNYEPYYFGTLAGASPYGGTADGAGAAARFFWPGSVAVDSEGNIFVADSMNHTIRKMTPSGLVSTFAGRAATRGYVDAFRSDARFAEPRALAIDRANNLYVVDAGNRVLRKITPDGAVTTYAENVLLNSVGGIAVDGQGNVYVADSFSHIVVKIGPDGVANTLAGLTGNKGSADGLGAAARFNWPAGLAADAVGNVYVADQDNCTIRAITPAGQVTTLAGSVQRADYGDGVGNRARFASPQAVAVDGAGNVYVADSGNSAIRKITPAKVVSTFAGSGATPGSADGVGTAARFYRPEGLALAGDGTMYVADTRNNSIRKVSTARAVSTIAGTLSYNHVDGPAERARFRGPTAIAVHPDGTLLVADSGNFKIRSVDPKGLVGTLTTSGGTLNQALLGIAVSKSGTIYIADTYTIRNINAGVVSTFAGWNFNYGYRDGVASEARFHEPRGLAFDSIGNLFVADSANHVIRKVTPSQIVSTFAGLGLIAGSADGVGSEARFKKPTGLAIDAADNIYVTDHDNATIRKITPGGVVSTFAGTAGLRGTADGAGSAARFATPSGLAIDAAGNLYVTDGLNHNVRKVTPAGLVSTLAGSSTRATGTLDGIGAQVRFNEPTGIAVDSGGRVYIADGRNNTLRAGGVVRQAQLPKNHGATGVHTRELLPFRAGNVESRTGSGEGSGDHGLVLRFARDLASASVAVTSGDGSVADAPMISGDTITLHLTGVSDVQSLTLTFSDLMDTAGRTMPDTSFRLTFLAGDANGDSVINAADVLQIRSRSGQALDSANFASDVNADGAINGADSTIVRAGSGRAVP